MKMYSLFLLEKDDLLYEEHIPYYDGDEFADERKQRILATYGEEHVKFYFASTDLVTYLKYLVKTRVKCLESYVKRNEKYLEKLRESDAPVRVLHATRVMQTEQEVVLMHQVGRTANRYLKKCVEADRDFDIDEVALLCLDHYNKEVIYKSAS